MTEMIVPGRAPLFPELLQLSYRWIYDSGASRHLCSNKDAADFLRYATTITGITVATADGIVNANQVVEMRMSKLGGMLAEVMVLPDTLSLISAGPMENAGYTYIWAHGFLPCLFNNDSGHMEVFDLISHLPIML